MKVFQKSRPSPAMIVAVIALSFALVGTAVAGTEGLERAVSKSKVKKIAKKQANKRITAREASLNVNSATTADTVVDGAITAPKLGSIVTRVAEVTVNDGAGNATNATCADGERLISGGARLVTGVNADVQLTSSRPQTAAAADPAEGEEPAQWRAAGFNPAGGTGAIPLRVFAVCIQ